MIFLNKNYQISVIIKKCTKFLYLPIKKLYFTYLCIFFVFYLIIKILYFT